MRTSRISTTHGDVDPQFYDDSVHPNDAGYKLIASAVADAIRQQFPGAVAAADA